MSQQVAAHPVSDSERILISLALSIATFMQALDSSIANVAIPTICGDLGVSTTQGTWIITSFSVSLAISVPLTGWLSRRIGEVRLFVITVALFTLASWGCGLSNNLPTLIFFRVLQGAMAGPMTPMAQTLLLSIYPPDKKGTALGLFSMTVLLAPIFGPLLGGWITDHVSWPWIFFINLPIGLLCAYSCWIRLRHRETKIIKDPIDKMGLALIVVGVGALQVMFDQGRELDWFNSPQIILLAIVAAVALTALIIWEWTAEHPIIDLRLFSDRNFTIGTIAMSLVFSLYMGIVVIQPLWLQTNMGYTASWAGLVMAPSGILAIFLMPMVGRYLHLINARAIITGSFWILALCCFLRARFTTDVSFGYLSVPQWLQGVANAGLLVPLTALILSNISPQNIASASGLTTFCRTLATSLGTSLTTTLWDRRASVHHTALTEHISLYNSSFTTSAFKNLPNGYAVIEQMLNRQAYMASIVDLFWLYGWLFLIAAPVVWFAKKPKAGGAPIVVVD
ncbi:MAG: inner rane component of tripartite multidrug resistance system [Verrucomicrobiaceae bacterium]|nr:inner rane component of tripartite multidrug resistance system [Verrucomicrobiaceae bacterium]